MIVKNCTLIKALSCKKDASVVDVAKILRENKQRRIIVVNKNDEPVGIISTTDMNNKVVAENKNPSELKAEDIMVSPIYLTCDLNDDLNNIYKKMMDHKCFFVPVTKQGKLFGILTYGELVKRAQQKLR